MSQSMIGKINVVRAMGKQYRVNSEIEQSVSDIEKLKPKMAEIKKTMKNVETMFSALNDIGCTSAIDTSTLKSAIESLKACFTKNDFNFAVANTILSEAKQIENLLITRWKEYVKSRIGPASSLYQSIKTIIGDDTDAVAMQNCEKTIFTAKPASDSAIKAIEGYLEHYNALMAKLNFSPELLEVVKKLATSNNVMLNSISSQCLEEMMKYDFANRIVISIP